MPKPENPDAVVLQYLKQQNRPYSASDIHMNLHKAQGKTAIIKSLESLAAKGKVLEKTYGKAKIYVYHQSQFPDVSDEDLAKLDEEIKQLQSKIDETSAKLSSATKTYSNINSQLSTEQAEENLQSLKAAHKIALAGIAKRKQPGQEKVDPKQKEKLCKKRDEMSSLMRKRKRCTNDLMNAVLEGYPKSKKQFVEEVGLELD